MAKKADNRISADTYISLALGLAVVLLVGATIFNLVVRNRSQIANPLTENGTEASLSGVPAVHHVLEGDTLWSIADRYYQNGYNWVDIAKNNNLSNPDQLTAGQILNIPIIKKQEGQIDTTAATTDGKPLHSSVTVIHGESLWSIATREYGDGYRWTEIAKTNNLTNPDLIFAGNVLRLP